MVVFAFYIVFQIQAAFELRRDEYKLKKEGMENKPISKDTGKKHVSFSDQNETVYFTETFVDKSQSVTVWDSVNRSMDQVYKLWILPSVYKIFKGMGV
jgi:hypothetical protein